MSDISLPLSSIGRPAQVAVKLVKSLEANSTVEPREVAEQMVACESSVVNHVALSAYLRRVAHASKYGKHYTPSELARFTLDEPSKARLENALEKSWQHFTGKVPASETQLLGPLPQPVTSRAGQGAVQLHEALLGDSLEVRLEPEAALQSALRTLQGEPSQLRSQSSKLGPAAIGISALALGGAAGLGALGSLAAMAAGFATSWLVNSMVESVFHDKFGHARDLKGEKSSNLVSTIYKYGPEWVKKPTYNLWFGHHVVHHYRTFREDHATQFRNQGEQTKLDHFLRKEGQQELIDAEYGVTMSWKSFLKYQATALPAYALTLGAAALAGAGLPFALGFVGPALAFPSMSKIYHRYTHMPAKEAMETASYPMRLYLQSDLSRFTVRHHFIHHVDPTSNFNLMPGADWIRGTTRSPDVADLEEMRRLKLLF